MNYDLQLNKEDGRLWCTFTGTLDAAAGQKSAARFQSLLPREGAEVVFDIRAMEGYEKDARVAWQTTLKPLRGSIKKLWVVGGNPLVRMGANLLGAFISVRVQAVEDPSGIR